MLLDLEAIVGILSSFAAIAAAIFAYPAWKQWRTQRLLEESFGAKLYDQGTIERSTRYYIRPNCSSIDPVQEAEIRLVVVTKERLFEKIDEFLSIEPSSRHLLLLADSGMGKSSFVLNYYAYNQHRPKHKRHRLTIIPLGIPEADEVISNIDNKGDTVIFLDAFDEDTKAMKDHRGRLFELMKVCREFKRVLITCRTQFFPSDEEIPKETGIVRIGPRKLGESGVFEFWKLYLTPFSDEQVDEYVRKRYPKLQFVKRRKARELIQKIPLLSVRPMLLAYIPHLLDSDTKIEYSFQLYDIMVEKWLEREKSSRVQPEALRDFSERLAVDLYLNREERDAERIPGSELIPLAQEWKINLSDWQLRGRSLLNRDASGNYKFAHRSILEYLFVKRLINRKHELIQISRTDQMNAFLFEMFKAKWPETNHDSFQGKNINMGSYPLILRSDRYKSLSDSDVQSVLRKWGFYDQDCYKEGKGILHLYQLSKKDNTNVVIDYATGLMWQQSGSEKEMYFDGAKKYVQKMNQQKLAGYRDWRLPTLEEAMSLIEPDKKSKGLHINPVFDKKQDLIWTTDRKSLWNDWWVNFFAGSCEYDTGSDDLMICHVRAVRSERSWII